MKWLLSESQEAKPCKKYSSMLTKALVNIVRRKLKKKKAFLLRQLLALLQGRTLKELTEFPLSGKRRPSFASLTAVLCTLWR